MRMRSFILDNADGAQLRFSRAGPPGARDVLVESSSSGADGSWATRARIPPLTAGWVPHNLALLGACELVFGRHGAFVKGSKEDVEWLAKMLDSLG